MASQTRLFEHRIVPLDPLVDDYVPHRVYRTPEGAFPSVTTVIGWVRGNAGIDAWRRRVGEQEANRVGTRARLRGTAVHSLAEAYLRNDPEWKSQAMPMNLASFLQVKPLLDEHVGTIYGIEVPLWSKGLRTAGRADLLADWDGVPAIIDFKTSTRIKDESQITGYFIQETCYGLMAEERIPGLVVPLVVTLMMVDHETPQVWLKRKEDYREETLKVFVDAPRPWEDSGDIQ